MILRNIRKQLLALDFDGTIVTCRDRQVAVAQYIAKQLGVKPFDEDVYWNAKRNGANTRAALVETGMSDAEATAIATRWTMIIEDRSWLRTDSLFVGVRQCLEELRERNVDTLLLTARQSAAAVHDQIAWLRLSFNSVEVVDPANACVAKAAILAEQQPLCFIGDTESDAASAAHADIPFIGVLCGQRSSTFLASCGVSMTATCLNAAVKHLMRIREE